VAYVLRNDGGCCARPVKCVVDEGEVAGELDLADDLVVGGTQVEGRVCAGPGEEELHSLQSREVEARAFDSDGECVCGGGEFSVRVAVVGMIVEQE
jgi:hypothetical protein